MLQGFSQFLNYSRNISLSFLCNTQLRDAEGEKGVSKTLYWSTTEKVNLLSLLQSTFLACLAEVFSSQVHISITRFGKCELLLLLAIDHPGQ